MTTNTAGSETVSAVLRALRERLEIAEDFPDDVLDEAAAWPTWRWRTAANTPS